jgi:hypothetical protein
MAEDLSLLDRTERVIAAAVSFQHAAQELAAEMRDYHEAAGDHFEQAALPPAEEAKPADKRQSYRKQGPPVPLHLSYSNTGHDPFKGWIVDCSQTGIGVTIDWPLPEGSLLFVRPINAPARLGWFQVKLRNCRKDRNRFHIGCQFMQRVAPEDLDLFEP